ncbi:MAG: competence/damage-inducible protein A [Saprospiraceae bacterium]|nr:competence/damage-inducible protein A [Saprospiraceae bacterium]
MTVHILTVGDEILIGQIIDTNSAWMAQQLNLIGARVVKKTSVGDTLDAIQNGIRAALIEADILLMTGGLGPTKDDITKKAIADFFGVELVFDQPTYDRIVHMFEKRNIPIRESHRIQCFMPSNAMLLENKMGTAPGMWFELDGKVLVSMPGVPYEMEYLMEYEVLPRLKQRFQGQAIAHRTILTVGTGETEIANRLESFENQLPENIKLAYLPALGQVRLRLTGIGDDENLLNQILDQKAAELESLIPEIIFGHEKEDLESAVGQMLRERGLKLGLAESCTGGYLAHRITSVSGSSEYFMGGVVPYTNQLKMKLLDVKEETLEQYGAVSEQTVIEMVRGALPLLNVDIAISVSGIAGPSGGTPEKPVGLVWLAIGNKDLVITKKIMNGKDRLKNIHYTAIMAMDLLRKFVVEHYIIERV